MTCVHITRSALEHLRTHLARAFPQEGCGLLLGHADEGRITVALPCANERDASGGERDGRGSFAIGAHEILDAHRTARASGLELVGVYHSHPSASPVPSRADRRAACGDDGALLWPGHCYFVARVDAAADALRGTTVLCDRPRAFRLARDAGEPAELRLEVIDDEGDRG